MASGDQALVSREPSVDGAEGPFDLKVHVMSSAAELPFFWPRYNAEKTQTVLQDPGVEDGTFILRPSGEPDVEKKKLLTLSVKMNFANDPTKVWHFPVIIDVEDRGEAVPAVYYSLTVTASNPISSLSDLMEYHSTRPLRGGKLPDTCLVTRGLPYRSENGLPTPPSHIVPAPFPKPPKTPVIYVVTCPKETATETPELPELPVQPTDEPAAVAPSSPAPGPPKVPVRNNLHVKAQSQRIPRSPSPTPSDQSRSATLPARPRPPKPIPRERRHVPPSADPPLAPRRPDPYDSETSSICSSTSGSDNRVSGEMDLCQCGLPTSVTNLPKGWTVHRSTEPESINMLYFRDMASRTAWVLPPNIDKECKSREYLKYGCLNVSCFRKYESQLAYSANSELSKWSEYSTYDRKP